MNAKDRRTYHIHHRRVLRHIARAKDAVAEMDAVTFQQENVLNSVVRDLRDLLHGIHGLALSVDQERFSRK